MFSDSFDIQCGGDPVVAKSRMGDFLTKTLVVWLVYECNNKEIPPISSQPTGRNEHN